MPDYPTAPKFIKTPKIRNKNKKYLLNLLNLSEFQERNKTLNLKH